MHREAAVEPQANSLELGQNNPYGMFGTAGHLERTCIDKCARRLRSNPETLMPSNVDFVTGDDLDSETHIRESVRSGVVGRKPTLDPAARSFLSNALRGPAGAFGFESDRWTDGRFTVLIARIFGVRFSRVYARRLIIKLGFAELLKSRCQPLGTGAVRGGAKKQISEVVHESPRAYGFDSDCWTNERLRIAIERRCGVKYSRTHVWKIISDLGLNHLIVRARK